MEALLSLHLSKCRIVGNQLSRLKFSSVDIVSLILIGKCMMMLEPYEDVIRHPDITPICEDNK